MRLFTRILGGLVLVVAILAMADKDFWQLDRSYRVELGVWFGYSNSAEVRGDHCTVPRTGIAEVIDTVGVRVTIAIRTPYAPEEGCKFQTTRHWIRMQYENVQVQEAAAKYLNDILRDSRRVLSPRRTSSRRT